jgi:hypothetical protein
VKGEQVRAGALIGGGRVTSMTRGMGRNGRMCVRFGVDGGPLGAPVYYGDDVPGTGPRTDIPAGPVGAGRGVRRNGAGRGSEESPMAFAERFITNLSYGC